MPESFGTLLRSWRGQRRLSQLDLSLAANVSARHISFLETGRARPSRAMVLALDIALADVRIELMFPADAATQQVLEAMS